MVCKKIPAVVYNNNIEQVSTLRLQNAAFVVLNLLVHIKTTVLWLFIYMEVGITDPKFVLTFSIIKPTRCTNFSNLLLKLNSIYFGQFLCTSLGVFECTHSSGIWHTGLLCLQWKTPDDRQRNCPKHVEFHLKNKFEKLVHLVSFYYKKFITMHAHMNVKFVFIITD